jgi:hypothetical protein
MDPCLTELTRDLCAYKTGVVADGNAALFDRNGRELPLQRFAFASGDTYNGWRIPDNWRVKRPKLYREGTEVFYFTASSLGVGYSTF